MSIRVTMTGSVPGQVWDQRAMTAAATLVRSAVVVRTFQDHRGSDDRPMRPYSTRPLKLYYRTDTAKRLKPKGGQPFAWVKGPRKLDGTYDETKIGDDGGRFYGGGYAEFKRASTRGGGAVDLTLSGQMARGVRVLRVEALHAEVGLTGQAQVYGPHTDAARPWVDMSPRDLRQFEEDLPGVVTAAMGRS